MCSDANRQLVWVPKKSYARVYQPFFGCPRQGAPPFVRIAVRANSRVRRKKVRDEHKRALIRWRR
jgi:hypothetical protein